ncbi:DUF2971 domain-containing protein (plasmid) [Microbulbifer sp. MKSA007]|nr:DUF2971 domain-containing protein [Microbulbifer sp. MKSA007]
MLLYNFVSDEFGRSNLENRRLKVSFPNAVNDLYEHKPFDFGSREVRKKWNQSIDLQSQTHGFVSFCEEWGSPAMWAHYANNHRGICCGFEVNDNLLTKMDYVDELRPFNIAALRDLTILADEMDYALQTKSSIWSYEREWRMHIKLGEEEILAKKAKSQEVFFADFNENMKLREIIIGVHSDITSEQIKDNLDQKENVQIISARPSFREYKMVPQRQKALQK